jgi:hypothetical protein
MASPPVIKIVEPTFTQIATGSPSGLVLTVTIPLEQSALAGTVVTTPDRSPVVCDTGGNRACCVELEDTDGDEQPARHSPTPAMRTSRRFIISNLLIRRDGGVVGGAESGWVVGTSTAHRNELGDLV